MFDSDLRVINKALGTSYSADDIMVDVESNRLIEVLSGKELILTAEALAEIAREKRKEHLSQIANHL